jgi:hypothetical protein
MQLEAAARAKKHVYVEKPMARNMKELLRAVDTVKAAGIVAQVGTQLRSMSSMTGARDFFKTGALGNVARIEPCRNSSAPYWYSYVKDAKAEDIDWDEFLMDAPKRPFDAGLYSGWYGYRDYSDGPVPGLARLRDHQILEAIRAGEVDLPPIIVERDADGLYIVDGHHRFFAAREMVYEWLPVREYVPKDGWDLGMLSPSEATEIEILEIEGVLVNFCSLNEPKGIGKE